MAVEQTMACAVDELETDPLQGEGLLLRTLRMLALEAACPALRRLFEDACGCGGAEAYRALEVFVQQLRLHARRPVGLSCPGRPPSADERLIVDAFACAQLDDYQGLEARLEAVAGAEAPIGMGAAVCLVAQVFALAGLLLSVQAVRPARNQSSLTRFLRNEGFSTFLRSRMDLGVTSTSSSSSI